MSTRNLTVLAALLGSLVVPGSASARDYKFKPFTDLNSVCPKCEPPAADVLTLKDGRSVRGTVIAANAVFYTVNRNGEVRTVARDEVQNVTWRQGSQPNGIDTLDQIVLKNGHVVTGNIVKDEKAGRILKSATPVQTFIVATSETVAVFKKGAEAK